MAVIMISDVPGADAGLIDGLRAAGVPTAMAAFPGFVSHVSGATETGYRVVEVWDSAAAHRAWFDAHIAPTLPPGVKTTPPQYIDVALTVPET
jgi:heme-degrading monooxygenase HmoA